MKRILLVATLLAVTLWSVPSGSTMNNCRDDTDFKSKEMACYDTTEGSIHTTTEELDFEIDDMNAVTGWACTTNDCLNITLTNESVNGGSSIEFDKVDGAANGTVAIIAKTITSVNVTKWKPETLIHFALHVTSITDISNCFIRLGTNSTNYSQWTIDDSEILENIWLSYSLSAGGVDFAVAGTGLVPTAITYVAVGCTFDLETDALADIAVDDIAIHPVNHVATSVSEVQVTTITPNMNLQRVSNSAAGVAGAGGVQNGTQRTTSASDSPLVIKSAGDMDDTGDCVAITGTTAQTTLDTDSDYFEICASGNTAFLNFGANPTVDHTVNNFHMFVSDGPACRYKYATEAKVAVIGVAAGGFVCFHTVDAP